MCLCYMPHGHWQISTLFTIPTHKPFAVLFPPASRHLPVGYPVHKYEVVSSFSITPCHDWFPRIYGKIRQVFHVPFTKLYVFGIVHGTCFHAPGHGTDSTLLHCPPPSGDGTWESSWFLPL